MHDLDSPLATNTTSGSTRAPTRRRVLQATTLAGAAELLRATRPPTAHANPITQAPAASIARLAAPWPTGTGSIALPMLGDGMNMDRPEYYETLQTGRRLACHTVQSADVDGDGQDELLVRGPGGILAFRFDADSGQ